MKIFVGCDHAGFELKQKLISLFPQFEWQDQGAFTLDSVDYPDFADLVCQGVTAVSAENPTTDALAAPAMGLLICGSGQGMVMRANKYQNIRAALCWNEELAKLSREHNNANVLCFGSRFITVEEAATMIKVFFATPFAQGRHSLRVEKLSRDTDC